MDLDQLNTLLANLERAGWSVVRKSAPDLSLNDGFHSRYADIPTDYLLFLRLVESCVNPDKTAWFLTEADYNGASDTAFAWNEFEAQSLDAAEGDSELMNEIRRFWDGHLPIMLSVKSGYAFLAIVVAGDDRGRIVHGVEPEYEDATHVVDSFPALMEHLVETSLVEDRLSILRDFA